MKCELKLVQVTTSILQLLNYKLTFPEASVMENQKQVIQDVVSWLGQWAFIARWAH